jgi:hydroxyisourate hydrolase
MTHLTTHVLDAATGTPRRGRGHSRRRLRRLRPRGGAGLGARPRCDRPDGRLAIGPESLPAGDYTLTFLTGEYFSARGVKTFYPFVTVTFTVEDASRHHHVPLLLSPFAYSTYRGS